MLSFDLPTMLLMTVASSVTMAVAIVAVRHDARKDGLGLWSIALLLHACAYVLLALRGRVPDMVSVVLANIVLSGVFALMLAAVLQFQGRVPRWWQTAVPVAATAVLFTVFVEHYVARLVIAGMLFSAQLGLSLGAVALCASACSLARRHGLPRSRRSDTATVPSCLVCSGLTLGCSVLSRCAIARR